ncbi:hypothetical protein BLNAU_15662 [Blattamonas nauphoetae]|uniref:MULE transposase domain-containing protein n=1 Tax=Blattamonas nauphoetae TaxID=2049346 RepID=A0ABQ9XBR9_9EUKA|nr:hypothetical protein BLNAU_15662 [Blattamonas nauphoetae]
MLRTNGLPHTAAFVTDADAGMAAALKSTCPHFKHILCRWHIQRNVEAHVRSHLGTHEDIELLTQEIMAAWANIVDHDDLAIYSTAKSAFLAKFDTDFFDWSPIKTYLEEQWFSKEQYFVSSFVNACSKEPKNQQPQNICCSGSSMENCLFRWNSTHI